jgi:hypothetical protein
MKKILLPAFIWMFLAGGGVTLRAQVNISGFISLDYMKERAAGLMEGTFRNAQAGLVFSGLLTQDINWLSEIRMKAESEFSLNQAWIQWSASSLIQPAIGLYLVPFGIYNQSNRPHQTALIEFPLPVRYLYPRDWRDLGFVLEGRLFGLRYSAYAGNGMRESEYLNEGQQLEDHNSNKSLGFRLNIPLDQGLEGSYSIYRGKVDSDDVRSLLMHALSGGWTTEGFRFTGEYYWVNLDNPDGFEQGEAEGYYVQLMVNLGGFRPVASYQSLVYKDPFHGPGFSSPIQSGTGIDLDESCWTLGLNYILSGEAVLKLEYQFDTHQSQEEEGRVLLFQAALSF